jgi:hypothetical protein
MSFEPVKARAFGSFEEGLRMAYEEEISGETYFARLAEFQTGRAREALELMAAMEVVTARAIEPVLARHGILTTPVDQLRQEGRAEADRLAHVSATELFTTMRDTYDAYVAEFEATLAQAPDADKPAVQILIDHEVAIIDFSHAELRGDAESLQPLQDYLARFAE